MSENYEQPFLSSEESINFLQSYGRVMFITRGLPGSGKAGIEEAVKEAYPGCKIIYAGQMFLGIGAVEKTDETTTQAHLLCQKRFCWFGMEESNKAYFNQVKSLIGTTHLLQVYGYAILNEIIYGLVELDGSLQVELASGDAVESLGTALWKPTSCIIPPDTVLPLADEVASSASTPPTHAPTLSKHTGFIVLGDTNGTTTTPNAPRPRIAEIWQNASQKTADLRSMRISGATVKDSSGIRLILLDDVLRFKSVFAGFYQPYLLK
ncbi:hypothetical protein MTO96_009141 [Rhipicephalus appendiculatus]